MAGDAYTKCPVGEIAAKTKNSLVGGPFGSDLVSRDYVPVGVPVIRGANMGQGRWVGGKFAYVTEEKAVSLASNCAKPGDLTQVSYYEAAALDFAGIRIKRHYKVGGGFNFIFEFIS